VSASGHGNPTCLIHKKDCFRIIDFYALFAQSALNKCTMEDHVCLLICSFVHMFYLWNEWISDKFGIGDPHLQNKITGEDGCLLGCCTMQSGRYWPTFSEELTASTNKAMSQYLPDYTVQNPREQPSSSSSPWEPEISPKLLVSIYLPFCCQRKYITMYLNADWFW
jgi:hypothetical protein